MGFPPFKLRNSSMHVFLAIPTGKPIAEYPLLLNDNLKNGGLGTSLADG